MEATLQEKGQLVQGRALPSRARAATATAVSPALLLCCCCCFLSPRCEHGCGPRAVRGAEHPAGMDPCVCIHVCIPVHVCIHGMYPCLRARPQPLRTPELLVSPPRWLRASPCESRQGCWAAGRIRIKLEQGGREEEQRWPSGLQEAGAGPGGSGDQGDRGWQRLKGVWRPGLCTDVTLSSFFCPSSESPERSRL